MKTRTIRIKTAWVAAIALLLGVPLAFAATGSRWTTNNANAPDQVFGSDTLALGQAEDLANQGSLNTYVTITSGSSSTRTGTEWVNGIYAFSSGTTYTMTTPTAAAIVAAMPNVQVGSSFDVLIYNANSGTLTLTLGSGVTAGGGWPATLATNKGIIAKGIVTNATAGSEAVVMFTANFAPAL